MTFSLEIRIARPRSATVQIDVLELWNNNGILLGTEDLVDAELYTTKELCGEDGSNFLKKLRDKFKLEQDEDIGSLYEKIDKCRDWYQELLKTVPKYSIVKFRSGRSFTHY